ncbi:MAG: exosortase-associated EpsI family protein [Opitutales bacterium]
MLRKIVIAFGLLTTALVAAAVVHQSFFYKPPRTFTEKLEDIIPREVGSWRSTDKDLAATPEQQRNVDEILQYTDAMVREYRRGALSFEVYVAYWAPKTMPVRLVQAHTPDICWVRGGGWSVDRDAMQSGVALEAEGSPLKLAEYRRMVVSRNQAVDRHVYYWHVIGDQIYTTKSIGTWDRWDPVKSLFRFGLNQQTEQFFIRVSSPVPFERLWEDPGVQEVMASLADLALAKSVDAPVGAKPEET